ncbi:MAG: aminofutalosine synthase MqnE [Candidatus Riflebacteria bacterium]|nr:aminofutalosine synthase MqnE [Candidatus Riflebacteria bacterium]
MARVFPKIEFADKQLSAIAAKVENGERLVLADGLTILNTSDLPGLGKLADRAKRQRSGDAVYFSTNKHVNYTNICKMKCGFCRFSKSRDEVGAYEMSFDEIIANIEPTVREVHLVGGLHPDWPFSHYVEMLKTIRINRPGVSIKGFTAVEILHFSDFSGLSTEQVLTEFKNAGLISMPGGGAEIFSPRVRKILCPKKPSGKKWLDVHKTAHGLGIPSNATMLYGHVETFEERIEHLTALRNLQDQTKGFLCFVPLPFQNWNKTGSTAPGSCDDLRMVALSRLYLDNFPHIKAYWVMLGLETAIMSLCYGADDMDGTVQGEKIAHAAGAQTPLGIDRDMIRFMARQAGKIAVERDSLYNRIQTC